MMSAKQIIKNSSHHLHAPLLSSHSRSQTKSIYFSIALFEFCLLWIFIMMSIVNFQSTSPSANANNQEGGHRVNYNDKIIKSQNLLEQCLISSKTCSEKLMTCLQSKSLDQRDAGDGINSTRS